MSQQQSTFVSVLAWIFIIFAGFATFVSILQNIMLLTVFPADITTPKGEEFPYFMGMLFDNIRLYFFGIFVITSIAFVSAVGLLKRKEWARKTFMGILGFGILYLVGVGVIQHLVLQEMPGFGEQMAQGEKTIVMFIRISSVVMILGFGTLFGWIIKRLMSPQIKAEFQTS